jgi:hypothetical protein
MPEQFDPRIYERFVAPSVPVNPDQINRYNQQPIPVAVPVPEFQNYAPQQQFVQQAPQQMLQPDPQLIAYNKLIEDRFNELANKFGGVRYLAETGNLERAQKKAARDIASYWGPPPKPQQPPQDPRVIEIDGNKIATGGDFRSPVILPTEAEKQSQALAVKKAEAELAQAEQKSQLESGKAQQESAGSLTGLAQSVRIFDQASKLAKSMRSSPVLSQAVGGGDLLSAGMKAFERSVAGTPEYDFAANANRLKSAAFAQAITMLKGMGALSNAEGQAITNSLTDVDNLKQSPEQYQKRLDEFSGLMDALIASKQKELALIQGQSAKTPSLNLETFDLGSLPPDNAGLPADANAQAQPAASNKPIKVSSPGAIIMVRDPKTGKMIRQQ